LHPHAAGRLFDGTDCRQAPGISPPPSGFRPLLDGLTFDALAFQQDGLAAAEVDVARFRLRRLSW
jgi:hypothetical protein